MVNCICLRKKPMPIIPFTKMQGLGNDFVVIDAITQSVSMTSAEARAIADRRYGVGCDQVLLITPSQYDDMDFGYRIFNADGHEVFQCGNGARCVGWWIWKKKLSNKKTIRLHTQQSQMTIWIQPDNQIKVEMGVPNFQPRSLPFITDEKKSPYTLSLEQTNVAFDVVSIGNPHAVLMSPVSIDLCDLGEKINRHTAFPEGVNVGVMECISPTEIVLRVYERGAGMTQACGSGAAAAVAAGIKNNLLNNTVRVRQPGGELTVDWLGGANPLYVTGPASFAFEGVWTTQHK